MARSLERLRLAPKPVPEAGETWKRGRLSSNVGGGLLVPGPSKCQLKHWSLHQNQVTSSSKKRERAFFDLAPFCGLFYCPSCGHWSCFAQGSQGTTTIGQFTRCCKSEGTSVQMAEWHPSHFPSNWLFCFGVSPSSFVWLFFGCSGVVPIYPLHEG